MTRISQTPNEKLFMASYKRNTDLIEQILPLMAQSSKHALFPNIVHNNSWLNHPLKRVSSPVLRLCRRRLNSRCS